jgi:hypothetical protein
MFFIFDLWLWAVKKMSTAEMGMVMGNERYRRALKV